MDQQLILRFDVFRQERIAKLCVELRVSTL